MAHQTLPPLPDLLPALLARMGAPPQDAAARFWVLGGEAPRLVAGTAGGPEYSLSVRSAGAAGEAGYAIRYHADHGFLRVLIAAEAQGVAPPARFRLELLFPDAPPLSGIVEYPRHALAGANLGRLGARRLSEVRSVLLFPADA